MDNGVCAHCGQRGEALRRCTGCWKEWYCSRDCQKRHWSRHKASCSDKPSSSSSTGRNKKRDKSKEKKKKTSQQGQKQTPGPKKNDGQTNGQTTSEDHSDRSSIACKTCETKCTPARAVKCKRCREVTYCSRDCRRADWLTHMDLCKPRDAQNGDREETKKADEVSPESKEEEEQSQTTKAEDSPEASPPCEDPPGEADAGTLRPELELSEVDDDKTLKTCQKCKTRGANMKKCGRCLEVTYCSRDCQKADWMSHKVTCEAIEVLTTDGYRETERREEEERRRQERRQRGTVNHLAHLLLQRDIVAAATILTWEDARHTAASIFPFHRIVDDFEDLESDFTGMPFLPFTFLRRRGAGVVALGRLTTPYFHPFRPARSVEDINGMSVYVIFYTSGSPLNLFSGFDFSDLKEGNFICIRGAFLHLFADGSIGFRVEDLSDIRIIDYMS